MIRVARPASPAWNLAKTMLQTTIMWSTALWILPLFVVQLEHRLQIPAFSPQPTLGWILFVSASSLGLWSAWTMAWYGDGTPLPFDTARKFVLRGPYRWIRNPMALAGITQGLSVGLIVGSIAVLIYTLAGMLLWQWIARPIEEADLLARFGDQYAEYQRYVRCWIPRSSPWSGKTHVS